MFGLKLVKKQDYLNLERELKDSQALLAEKYAIIASLEQEIKKLNGQIFELKKEETRPVKNAKTVLLTDIAENPLKVEEKPVKKVRKTTGRKTSHKSEVIA